MLGLKRIKLDSFLNLDNPPLSDGCIIGAQSTLARSTYNFDKYVQLDKFKFMFLQLLNTKVYYEFSYKLNITVRPINISHTIPNDLLVKLRF